MLTRFLGVALAAALSLALPAPSHADTYIGDPVAQDFSSGPGGWTASTSYEGLCIPSLLCPGVDDQYVATGGSGGDGYLSTRFSSLASTTAGTSTATWLSPSFIYHGSAGERPASVTFSMSLLRDLGSLLGLDVQNTSSYQVELVDETTGNAVSVIPATSIPAASAGWTTVSAPVDPALLRLERSYRIRISARFNSLAAVVGTGQVGYDDVRLVTADEKGDTGPSVPNRGSGITSRSQLRILATSTILPGNARLVGDKVKMRLRCPALAAPLPCKVQVTGLAGGKFSKPATARKVISIKAGASRTVRIRVKHASVATYRGAIRAHHKIWVKSTVRVGSIRVTVRKRVALR
jgi:hypothetical protein